MHPMGSMGGGGYFRPKGTGSLQITSHGILEGGFNYLQGNREALG